MIGLLLLAAVPAAAVSDVDSAWSRFRGPAAHGAGPVAVLPDGEFGLSAAWTAEIGSGYSNVSYADGRLFTQFTREPEDVLAAFDAGTGEELWSYSFGPKYAGHDGSEDGPLSTPTIDGDVVLAVGPRGRVVSLEAETGRVLWQFELDASNSNVPHYGYTTSPLVAGRALILATGGEGRALTALDRRTGEVLWTSGDDSVQYQTPSLLEVDGRQIVVSATDQMLYGLDPGSGDVLWEHRHSEGQHVEESAHVTQVGSDRFVVDYERGARLYRASADGVTELWRSRAFASSLSIPVAKDGYLYGFTRSILTCVDAETGEIAWRTRDVSGQGLSLVGGALAIVDPDGHLVLVDPSPDGYREITRIQALEVGGTAAPSFAGDAFVVRNMSQMVAVRPDRSAPVSAAPVRTTERLRGRFGEWIGEVERLPLRRRQAEVDRYFEGVERTPIVEEIDGSESALAHVVWRGEAEDVGVGGEIVGNLQDVGLERVEGTDLFFASLELVAAAQYGYNLLVDFGDPSLDPTNPYSADLGGFVVSELRMPEWPASAHLEAPGDDVPRGTLDSFPFRSEILDNSRRIQVWRPPSYDAQADAQFPLLVVNHGDNVVRGGLMPNTLDNLVGSTVTPLVVVFVPRVEPAEYGGPRAEEYTRFLTAELLPHLERHYRIRGTRRAIQGAGSAAVASLLATLRYPDVFSGVALQSFYPIEPSHGLFAELIAAGDSKPDLAFVIYSNRDYDLGNGVLAKDASREVLGWLRSAQVPTRELVSEYSPSWAGWRGQNDDILEALFPLQGSGTGDAD